MKPILLALRAEMHKGFWLLWQYRYNSLAELITMGIMFVGVSFLLGRGQMNSAEVSSILLGYLVWFFSLAAISNMSFNLMEEARAGTLEQMFMSPVPVGIIVLGRVFAMMLTAVLQVAIVGIGIMLVLRLEIPMRWQGIPIFLITITGLLGFGFFIGGLTLIYKQVWSIANMIQNTLIFLTGALVPVSFFPDWLEFLSKLLPSTQGIIVLRRVVLEQQTLLSAWQDGSLFLLILNSAIYFIGGWLFFMLCENQAKKQGTLGQY
jgi:ABC-2 type transport system permease protein